MDQGSTILITGGTGMIGSALSKMLIGKGYHIIILSRKMPDTGYRMPDARIRYAEWNIKNETIDKEAIQEADHIIHLAGANIAEKRWTPKRKKEILGSRTQSSTLLIKALKEIPNKVKTVVSASAIGWYGSDEATHQKGFMESHPQAEGFWFCADASYTWPSHEPGESMPDDEDREDPSDGIRETGRSPGRQGSG